MVVPARLLASTGIKWTRHPSDVLPLWVADMDLAPPRVAVRAVTELAERGDLGYHAAADGLADAWTAWQERHHAWRPDPALVRPFTSAMHAIDLIVGLCTGPGDGIIVLTPVYHPFLATAAASGRRRLDVPLATDHRLDPERLAATAADARVLLVCQPHNPTGHILDRAELDVLAEVAETHDLLVISDEVWADLTHPDGNHLPLASHPGLAPRLVTVGAASKTFNLAGLRCAVAHLGHPAARACVEALPAHGVGAPSSLSASASIAAWTDGGDWLASTRRRLTQRRDQLAARLAAEAPAIRWTPPAATYLAWLDVRATPMAADPAGWALERAGLALEDGRRFGPGGEGYVRLNYATTEAVLDEAVDRLVGALQEDT